MSLPDMQFSTWALVIFIGIAAVLFVIFRLLRLLYPLLIKKKEYRRLIGMALPVVELLSWLMFFVWSIGYFWRSHQIFIIGILVVLVFMCYWLSQYALKELIAGVVFRVSGRFQINESAKIGDYSGRIIRFRHQSIELETGKGKIVYVPYSHAIRSANVKSDYAEMITRDTLTITTGKKEKMPQTIENLRNVILQLPWTSIKKVPNIKPIAETEDSYTFEITVYSLDKNYFYKIRNHLSEEFAL